MVIGLLLSMVASKLAAMALLQQWHLQLFGDHDAPTVGGSIRHRWG